MAAAAAPAVAAGSRGSLPVFAPVCLCGVSHGGGTFLFSTKKSGCREGGAALWGRTREQPTLCWGCPAAGDGCLSPFCLFLSCPGAAPLRAHKCGAQVATTGLHGALPPCKCVCGVVFLGLVPACCCPAPQRSHTPPGGRLVVFQGLGAVWVQAGGGWQLWALHLGLEGEGVQLP
jgi:hypothetical protein